MQHLHELLAREGFTELRLMHDWRRGTFDLRLARTWDERTDWSRYTQSFHSDGVPCGEPRILGDEQSRGIVRVRGLTDYMLELESLMATGRHEMMVFKMDRQLNMRAALFVHSSVLGRNNGLHAIRAGGYRRHELAEVELDVFKDGLNLGRAMSFKNAAADLPLGGCKMTIQCDPISTDDKKRLGFLAFCIDSGRFVTGPDMGFMPEHSDVLRANFTRHTTGGRKGSMGPTGAPTALGSFLAIQEAADFKLGKRDLRGKRALIQGLGEVGLPLAMHLRDGGATLIITDTRSDAVERARTKLGPVEVIPAERALTTPCDILVPCAMGGILDDASIAALSCRVVFGPANNQLKGFSKLDELRLAEKLRARDILFLIEWSHNTAGVMAGFEEYMRGEEASLAHLKPRLEKVCRDGTRKILEQARAGGKTPTAIAYEHVERLIYPPLDA